MLANASSRSSTENQHRSLHRSILLLTLQPPLWFEGMRILTKNSLIELHNHGVHTDLETSQRRT